MREYTKPHIVLVHGSWHTGRAWEKVSELLEKQGLSVSAPTMPGHGIGCDPAKVEFGDYLSVLLDHIKEQAAPVMLVGHSSAGILLQSVALTAKESLCKLVYFNAFIVEPGQALIDTLPDEIAAAMREEVNVSADSSLSVNEEFFRHVLMPDVSEEIQDYVLSQLVPQPFSYYLHTVTCAANQSSVPKVLLLARDDMSLPDDGYRLMADRLLRNYQTIQIKGGHEALYTNPEDVAEALMHIVGLK